MELPLPGKVYLRRILPFYYDPPPCLKGPGSQKVIFFSNKLDLHILRNETRVVGKDFGEIWTLNSTNSLQEPRCKLVFFSPSGEILYFRWISEL